MKYQGSCKCGAVKLGVDAEPFLLYNCHCSHCRAFATKYSSRYDLFHTAGAIWRWNTHIQGNLDYEWTTSLMGLIGLSRGRCSKCKEPMVEYGERLVKPFAMVMCRPLGDLKPTVNLFYNSGHTKGTMGLKTLYSDLGSLLYEIFVICCYGLSSLPRSIATYLSNRKAVSF